MGKENWNPCWRSLHHGGDHGGSGFKTRIESNEVLSDRSTDENLRRPASGAPVKAKSGITAHRASRCSGLRHLYALVIDFRLSADGTGVLNLFERKDSFNGLPRQAGSPDILEAIYFRLIHSELVAARQAKGVFLSACAFTTIRCIRITQNSFPGERTTPRKRQPESSPNRNRNTTLIIVVQEWGSHQDYHLIPPHLI